MVLSLFIFPHVHYNAVVRVLWAFGVYVESFSMLPQLLMMQNAKVLFAIFQFFSIHSHEFIK